MRGWAEKQAQPANGNLTIKHTSGLFLTFGWMSNKEAVQVAAQKEGQSVTEYIMEAVRLRMEQENAMLDTPGVVKNLKGDADPVE